MKTETPFLDFYKQCMETGKLPESTSIFRTNGLCYHLGHTEAFSLFDNHLGYWGYNGTVGMSSTKENAFVERSAKERDKIREKNSLLCVRLLFSFVQL